MKVFVIKTLFYTQLIFPLAFIFIEITHAQSLYTNPVFSIRKDSAVYVGTAPNYCGLGYDIKVNIYKPIGDFNTKRPVAICIHGGAFTSSEDFNEPLTNGLAQEFAKRGYVGVCIDYREGHHL